MFVDFRGERGREGERERQTERDRDTHTHRNIDMRNIDWLPPACAPTRE